MSKLLDVQKSIYDSLSFDSGTESRFAKELDVREDIRFLLKMPSWFKVSTPLGTYNPDWAIVKADSEGFEKLYLVRETKTTEDLAALRGKEAGKVACGKAHFQALEVNFAVARSAADI